MDIILRLRRWLLLVFYEGAYVANIVCVCDGEKKIFDARSSDAINMALKFKSPIFASEEILRVVGFHSSEMEAGADAI